jgi:hypothetical protein
MILQKNKPPKLRPGDFRILRRFAFFPMVLRDTAVATTRVWWQWYYQIDVAEAIGGNWDKHGYIHWKNHGRWADPVEARNAFYNMFGSHSYYDTHRDWSNDTIKKALEIHL